MLHDLEAEIAAEETVPASPVPPELLIDPNLVSNPVGSRHDLRRAQAHLARRMQIDPDVFMSLGGGRRARESLRRRVMRDAAAGRIDLRAVPDPLAAQQGVTSHETDAGQRRRTSG
jgi:hypothetical protein